MPFTIPSDVESSSKNTGFTISSDRPNKVSATSDVLKTAASLPERIVAGGFMALPNIINQAVTGPQYLGRGIAESVDKLIGIDPQPRGDIWQPYYGSEDALQKLPKPIRPHNPETLAGAVTDSLGNVVTQLYGGKIGVPKAAKAAQAGYKNVSEGAGTMKSGYNARDSEALEGSIIKMENQAGKHFSTMEGVGISPEISTKVFDHIDKAVREEREIDPDLHADYVKTIERMKEKAKAGMTLRQMHLQRQLLRDVETKNFLNNKPVAAVARKAIDAMDEALETAKHKGGSEQGAAGVQGMQSGIAKWAQARKFETIANIIKRAQGDPNKLKSGFTTLLNNKKQMRGFTKEEISAIKSASENTSAEGLMKMVGKFGFDISQSRSGGNTLPWLAGFGAHMSGATTPELATLATVGTGAKYGQKLMARGKAENVLKAIESRQISPTIPNTGTPLESVLPQITQ